MTGVKRGIVSLGEKGIWQVARRAGAALGRFPAANMGVFSAAPVLRPPGCQHKPGNGPCIGRRGSRQMAHAEAECGEAPKCPGKASDFPISPPQKK